jgi:hypothetical protein
MTDNQLIQLFLPIIQNGLIADGFVDVPVVQSNQPTQQGINSNPTVYFYKVGDKRYGFLGRKSEWIIDEMLHTEFQHYETTFQIVALVRQDPNNTSLPTAADLVNEVAAIMQSDNARQLLNAANVGILRVTDVRNPYFTDDQDIFEASSSFDFTLVHAQIRESIDAIIDEYDFNFARV